MKKGLSVLCLSFLLFVVFTSCSLFDGNVFKESTLTLVNDSNYDISTIYLDNGYSGEASSKMIDANILSDGDVLEPGRELVIGLTPVLHESSYAVLNIEITVDRDTETYYRVYFTYEEGAGVIATFDPSQEPVISLENGEINNVT